MTTVVATSGAMTLAARSSSGQAARQLVRQGQMAVQVTTLATARERLETIGAELSVSMRQRPVLGQLGYVAMGIGNGVRKLLIWR